VQVKPASRLYDIGLCRLTRSFPSFTPYIKLPHKTIGIPRDPEQVPKITGHSLAPWRQSAVRRTLSIWISTSKEETFWFGVRHDKNRARENSLCGARLYPGLTVGASLPAIATRHV
jgi:hypothetical protein